MSVQETLEAEATRLTAVHEKNSAAYRASLKARDEANLRVREACTAASASANELGAVKKALEELNRAPDTVVHTAQGG